MVSTECSRCKGVGVSWWDALVDGFANLLGYWVGRVARTVCRRCGGTGRV